MSRNKWMIIAVAMLFVVFVVPAFLACFGVGIGAYGMSFLN